jgi:hypothetical protein
VGVAQAGAEGAVHLRDAGRPISRHLLADRKVQSHVQERVGLARLRRVVTVERILVLEQRRVFRVQGNHAHDLVLDRFDRARLAVLAPGFDVHASQRRAVLVVEKRHQ